MASVFLKAFEFLATTVPHTDSLPAVQYHGTQAGCQGLVAIGPYGMPHKESSCLLFQNCKFIS